MSRLDDTSRCPIAGACASCGGRVRLAVVAVETPVGVYCQTLCFLCGPTPPRSWPAAVEAVNAHCGHLGIDADEMETLMGVEKDERNYP